MINFVVPNFPMYKHIIRSMIDPIQYHLLGEVTYQENPYSLDNAVNVHLFREDFYIEEVKLKGINVFLSHGIADKNYRNYPDIKIFDYVIVSGDAWQEKLISQGCPKQKIFVGGYPKLDRIFQENKYHAPKENMQVLWCPTHTNGISTCPELFQIAEDLAKNFTLKISLHPANKREAKVTYEEFLNANVVINGMGSTLYEAWALEKSIVFPDFLIKSKILSDMKGTFEAKIYEDQIGYHANSPEEFIELIHYAIENGMNENSKEFIEGIFPQRLRGNSGKQISLFLENLDNIYIERKY